MSNSSLAKVKIISPNRTSPRNHAIDTITIHCMAGQLSAESCGNLFARSSTQASSNYGVGSDGKIGLYVEEKDRSWCTSNYANDMRAVTIEVASDAKHPYAVTEKAYNATVDLVTDICKRNGIKKLVWSNNKADRVNHKNGCNMTVHRDYAAKACPGDYLYGKMADIAKRVNAKLGGTATNTTSKPATSKPSTPSTSSSFRVKITAYCLNIRKGAGTNYAVVGQIKDRGVYTIVQTSGEWGKLKSGAGWIHMSYAQRI